MSQRPPRSRRTRRLARPATPSCRGGASSLLRLAQPAVSATASRGIQVTAWLARAAGVLTPVPAEALHVRPSEFAPSQWLVGH